MATIRDAGIFGEFVHEPLSDPQAEIRLVQIDLSGDKDSEIHCTISTFPSDNTCTPPYIAISYTWGDTSKLREIWINGKRLNVGHNNWLALWQARLHRLLQPLLIWMDVLYREEQSSRLDGYYLQGRNVRVCQCRSRRRRQ
jgi:hypothetical protein